VDGQRREIAQEKREEAGNEQEQNEVHKRIVRLESLKDEMAGLQGESAACLGKKTARTHPTRENDRKNERHESLGTRVLAPQCHNIC
jgi:hypothetical protein